MRRSIVAICLIFLTSAAAAERTAQLRVTATIPPPPCEYPRRCPGSEKTRVSEVRVDGARILYAGTMPMVKRQDGLTIVLF